jgi:hypothetical protein
MEGGKPANPGNENRHGYEGNRTYETRLDYAMNRFRERIEDLEPKVGQDGEVIPGMSRVDALAYALPAIPPWVRSEFYQNPQMLQEYGIGEYLILESEFEGRPIFEIVNLSEESQIAAD